MGRRASDLERPAGGAGAPGRPPGHPSGRLRLTDPLPAPRSLPAAAGFVGLGSGVRSLPSLSIPAPAPCPVCVCVIPPHRRPSAGVWTHHAATLSGAGMFGPLAPCRCSSPGGGGVPRRRTHTFHTTAPVTAVPINAPNPSAHPLTRVWSASTIFSHS